MKKRASIRTIILSVAVLSGCETTAVKETWGKVIGGGAGFFIGERFCGGKFEVLCKIGTTALGAYIGGEIGKKLDKEDQKRMALSTRRAFATGDQQSWSNSENSTSGSATVISSETKNETVKVAVLKERIKKVPPLDIIGENYRAKGASNLRGGPSVEYKKVGSLDEGEVFNVIGQVKDSNWYMVSQNGVGSGFIRSDLVEAAPDAELVIDESLIDETQLEQAEIAQERVCKTVEQTVTLADGTTESGTVEACQGANGWEVNV